MDKAKFKPGDVVHVDFMGAITGIEYCELSECWKYTITCGTKTLRFVEESMLTETQKECDI